MAAAFRGIFPALVTPMTSTEEVDHRVMAQLIDHLIKDGGVHGVVPLGSTGEFYSLTSEEREAVVRTVMEATAGRVPVLVGANAASTREVIAYCRQAEKLGAAGVLLAAPYYSLPTHDELFEHFKAIDESVGIAIMLYNYPHRTGVDMTPDLVERLAGLRHVDYIKESTGDVSRVSEIIRRCGEKITVFCGSDAIALESFLLGAVGWVSGAANFLAEPSVELFELAVQKQDFAAARKHYHAMLPVLSLLEGSGKYTQLTKAGCELIGRSVGPPRRPLRPATTSDVQRLKQVLACDLAPQRRTPS
jgi:4-hydroxy-tetrahydrodipicolinate synthase